MAATDKKISELTPLGAAPASDDYFEIVDASETEDGEKNKSLEIQWLFYQPVFIRPTIADLSNMTHTHASDAQGGALAVMFYENEIVSYENDLVFS